MNTEPAIKEQFVKLIVEALEEKKIKGSINEEDTEVIWTAINDTSLYPPRKHVSIDYSRNKAVIVFWNVLIRNLNDGCELAWTRLMKLLPKEEEWTKKFRRRLVEKMGQVLSAKQRLGEEI